MLDEDAVVRPAAQVAHGNVVLNPGVWTAAAFAAARGCFPLPFLPHVVDRSALGTGNLFGDLTDESFEAGHRRCAKVWPGDGHIQVEITDGVGELALVLLTP